MQRFTETLHEEFHLILPGGNRFVDRNNHKFSDKLERYKLGPEQLTSLTDINRDKLCLKLQDIKQEVSIRTRSVINLQITSFLGNIYSTLSFVFFTRGTYNDSLKETSHKFCQPKMGARGRLLGTSERHLIHSIETPNVYYRDSK